MILTPGQFNQRAEFYHQLAQLTAAGLGLVRALDHLRRNPPAAAYRAPVRRLLDQLATGCSFTEAAQRADSWLPEFDIALLKAGEHSGRLDVCFKLLADYYQERARLARQMLADSAYPVALLHLAVFLFPFAQFFTSGNWLRYLTQSVGVLLPLYAIVALLIYAAQSRHGETWRAWVEKVLRPVPVLGTARHYLALARLAASLEALLSAGVGVIEAWDMAGAASGSPALRRAVLAWKPDIEAGQTPAEAVRACPKFPELFANLYASGEISGKLDESLGQLHRYYQEEGSRKLHAVALWTPRLIYFAIALLIAYKVIQGWLGIYGPNSDLSHIMNGN